LEENRKEEKTKLVASLTLRGGAAGGFLLRDMGILGELAQSE
jgi:hypothetical protein